MNTTNEIVYCIVPASNPSDRYEAGYDGNRFDSRAEAEADIPNLAKVLETTEDYWTVRAFEGDRIRRDL